MNLYKLLGSMACGLFFTTVGASVALAGLADIGGEGKITTEASASLGYRSTSEDGTTGRALEYDSLESGPLFNAKLFTEKGPHYINLEIDYLNENDFSGQINFKTKRLFLVDLRTERFFHNLDHIPYDNGYTGGETDPPPAFTRIMDGTPAEGSRPDGTAIDTSAGEHLRAYYSDSDPGETYGLRLSINEAILKIKYPGYPAHFNLAYWRYEKEGKKQLRFVGENCATACHMQSKTRKIDRVTEEIKAGVDAHVGFVDLVVEGMHRIFRDRKPIPDDYFGMHTRDRDISGNPLQHSEDPDSSVSELTLKASTAPSGGLVGSTSFTIGQRENNSDLTSVGPVKATTDYYKTAADVTYTPGQKWTFNLRYRLLDIDSDNTNRFTDYDNSENPNSLDVRDSMDLRRAWYEAIVNYRPSSRLTLKAEVRREEIDRSDTGEAIGHSSTTKYTSAFSAKETITINPNWELPDKEIITRAKVGFHSRLLEKSALKIRGSLTLQHNDDPAYGTSFGKSQELFLATSYNPSPFWGVMANAKLLRQENKDHELHDHSLDRNKQQQNLSLGTWLNPRQGLSFDLNYGYLRTAIDQDLLFGTADGFAIEAENVDYRQTVHTVTVGMNWQVRENLSCRVEGYHIRSKANYSPEFDSTEPSYNPFGTPYDAAATSSDLRDISKIDIRQNGLRGRMNWQIDKQWSCAVEATLDDYDDRGDNFYDGLVQTTMVSLSRKW